MSAETEKLLAVLKDVTAHLVAAHSLLTRTADFGGKKAAPSNKMFDQMLIDYEASANRGRAALGINQRGNQPDGVLKL